MCEEISARFSFSTIFFLSWNLSSYWWNFLLSFLSQIFGKFPFWWFLKICWDFSKKIERSMRCVYFEFEGSQGNFSLLRGCLLFDVRWILNKKFSVWKTNKINFLENIINLLKERKLFFCVKRITVNYFPSHNFSFPFSSLITPNPPRLPSHVAMFECLINYWVCLCYWGVSQTNNLCVRGLYFKLKWFRFNPLSHHPPPPCLHIYSILTPPCHRYSLKRLWVE